MKDPSLFIQNGFIGGEWVPAKNGKTFPVYGLASSACMAADVAEPSSAEILGMVANMSREEFVHAIEIADRGYRKYSTTTTFPERGAQLRKWFELVHENLEDCTLLHFCNPI